MSNSFEYKIEQTFITCVVYTFSFACDKLSSVEEIKISYSNLTWSSKDQLDFTSLFVLAWGGVYVYVFFSFLMWGDFHLTMSDIISGPLLCLNLSELEYT